MIACAIGSENEPKKIIAICKKPITDGIGILEFFQIGGTYEAYENLVEGYLCTIDDCGNQHIIAESKSGNWESDNFLNEHFELIHCPNSQQFQVSVDVVYGIQGFSPDMLQ